MATKQVRDDISLFVVRKDISGGMNNRLEQTIIAENQSTLLYNVLLDVAGQRSIRGGATLVEDLSNNAGTGAFGFHDDDGTGSVIVTHGAKLEQWSGSGVFTECKTDFTSGLLTRMFTAGESGLGNVLLVSNGTDNWFRFDPSDWTNPQDLGATTGTGADSPPKSTAGCWFRNRVWILKANFLYYSTAYPADFSVAFDDTSAGQSFYTPVGSERAVLPIRDTGLLIFGQNAVYGLNPSATPAATDKPEKILDVGCAVGATACQVADDVLFLAYDGVRGVFRTQQDKLQMGQSFPLSFPLKTEFDAINWAQISKASAIYFDNKYLLTLPTTNTYNDQVWMYYPAQNAWVVITGWNIAAFAKVVISGQERLYGIDSNDGSVYRLFSGASDNGTAIAYQEEGRGEDFQKPMQYKYGGVFKTKIELESGSATVVVSASIDGEAYVQLGTLDTQVVGVSFPTTFPVTFNPKAQKSEQFHLEPMGRFKNIKFKIYCSTTTGALTVLESLATTMLDEFNEEE